VTVTMASAACSATAVVGIGVSTAGSEEPTAAVVIDAKTAPAGMKVRIKCMNNIHQVTAACGPHFRLMQIVCYDS
jgi:hypothetical protein